MIKSAASANTESRGKWFLLLSLFAWSSTCVFAQDQEAPIAPIYRIVPLVSADQLLPAPGELSNLIPKPRIIPQGLIQKLKDVDTSYLANVICYGAGIALDYNKYKAEHEPILKPILEAAEQSEAFLLAQLPWPVQTDQHQKDVYRYGKTLKLFFQQNPQFAPSRLSKMQEMVPTVLAIAEIFFRKQIEAGHFIQLN
jgi:hypothetical protein